MVVLRRNSNKPLQGVAPSPAATAVAPSSSASSSNPLDMHANAKQVKELVKIWKNAVQPRYTTITSLGMLCYIKWAHDNKEKISAYSRTAKDWPLPDRDGMSEMLKWFEQEGYIEITGNKKRVYPEYKVTKKLLDIADYVVSLDTGGWNSKNSLQLIPYTVELFKELNIDTLGIVDNQPCQNGEPVMQSVQSMHDTKNNSTIFFNLRHGNGFYNRSSETFIDFGGHDFSEKNFRTAQTAHLERLQGGKLLEGVSDGYANAKKQKMPMKPFGYLINSNQVVLESKNGKRMVLPISLQTLRWFQNAYGDRGIEYYGTVVDGAQTHYGYASTTYELCIRDGAGIILGYLSGDLDGNTMLGIKQTTFPT